MGKYISILAAILTVFLGCVAPADVNKSAWTNQPLAEENTMGLVPVGPAPGGPFATILCPDDGNLATAEDIRRVAAALLRNDGIIFAEREIEYTYADQPIPSLAPVITAPNTVAGNAWTDTSIVLEIADCKIGDDIKIDAWGSWQLNTASSATTVGRARIAIYLDPDGAPMLVPNLYGIATISDDSGALTLPHNENYSMHYRYRCTTDNKIKIVVQARSEDLSGGAGTATMVFLHSARMDVTHVKRTIP